MSEGVEDLSEMAQGSSWLRRSSGAQSRQRQKTRGMKAPIATKIGNMDELSSSVYGSATRGPLGFLRADVDSLRSSATSSSSGSTGSGASFGKSSNVPLIRTMALIFGLSL